MKKYLNKKMLAILVLLVVLSGCDIAEYGQDPILKDPKRQAVVESLTYEHSLIPAMLNATERKNTSGGKKETMLIGATYVTDCSYEEIFNYYDTQLIANDWQHYYRDDNVYTTAGRMGGKIDRYKKGDFVATIQYAGEKANYGWTYAFSMTWGVSGYE